MINREYLQVLGMKYGKQRIGLYRDDGLAWFENVNGPSAEKIRKDVIMIFKQEFNLNINIDVTLKPFNGKI